MLRNYDGKTMFKAALDGRIDAIISHESRNRNFFYLFFSQIFKQAAFFKAAVDGFGEDFFTRLRFKAVINFKTRLALGQFFSFAIIVADVNDFSARLSCCTNQFPDCIFKTIKIIQIIRHNQLLNVYN